MNAPAKKVWCTCDEQPSVCPVHDDAAADLWRICDVCCREHGRRLYNAMVGEILRAGVDAVTFFRDGWQLVEWERGEELLCPEHRIDLQRAFPNTFARKRNR